MDVEIDVVEISPEAVMIVGGDPCMGTSVGFVPLANFQDVPDLDTDDTHDLRSRWFDTEEKARAHATYVLKSWENPSPWKMFVQI